MPIGNFALGLSLVLGFGATVLSPSASAALHVRSIGGDYGVYDDLTDLTWLDSTRLGQFYSQGGAQAAVDSLTDFGFSDWRLPAVGSNPSNFSMPADSELQVLWQHLGNLNEDAYSGTTGGLFSTPYPNGYWNAETGWATYLGADGSWFDTGLEYAAWAVRTGDVSAVPVPAAVWLLGSALAGMGLVGRRRQAA